MALGPKQARFVEEYLKDLNATQAAERAGYSAKTAASQGGRLLHNVEVSKAIEDGCAARAKRTGITADVILGELLRLARVDIREAYDATGHLLPIKQIPEDVARAISGIKVLDEFEGSGDERVKIGEVREVKFHDKTRSLELLGKHLKLFTDKVEYGGIIKIELVDPYAKPAGK